MNCAVCNAACKKKCGQCNAVYYCSVDHQKQDWKTHKTNCLPYLVARNDELGRHMVATRKIKCYEEVLREAPLITGFSRVGGQPCLGCYKDLTKMRKHITCAKCGCPVCSVECAKSREHYPECSIISQHGEKVTAETLEMVGPLFDAAVSVLRCLHLKEQPKEWKKINDLKSLFENMDENMGLDLFIRLVLEISVFSTEEIMRMTSICRTNGHKTTTKNKSALYYNGSFMEHNCFANCFKSYSKTGELILVAARDIEPGEHLSISYTDQLYGTAKRRRELWKLFHFSCKCARCVDPTELGSHFSSLKCQNRGCTGFVIPMEVLKESSFWKCTSCAFKMLASQVDELIQYWDVKLKNIDKSRSVYLHRHLIEKCDNLFHPNHYFLTAIKISLAELLVARHGPSPNELTSEILLEILEYCQQIKDLLAKVMPADNVARGSLLFSIANILLIFETMPNKMNFKKYLLSSVESEQLHTEICNLLPNYEAGDASFGDMVKFAKQMLELVKFKARYLGNETKERESEICPLKWLKLSFVFSHVTSFLCRFKSKLRFNLLFTLICFLRVTSFLSPFKLS